jgi:hypothetical protein
VGTATIEWGAVVSAAVIIPICLSVFALSILALLAGIASRLADLKAYTMTQISLLQDIQKVLVHQATGGKGPKPVLRIIP